MPFQFLLKYTEKFIWIVWKWYVEMLILFKIESQLYYFMYSSILDTWVKIKAIINIKSHVHILNLCDRWSFEYGLI